MPLTEIFKPSEAFEMMLVCVFLACLLHLNVIELPNSRALVVDLELAVFCGKSHFHDQNIHAE